MHVMKAYAIGLYEKAMPGSLSWEEKLECARECGYDFVEITNWRFFGLSCCQR